MDTNRRLATVTAAALWGCLSFSVGTGVFAASNLVTPDSYQLVARAEQMFFGKTDTSNTFQRRLELLEIGIFGRVRSGSQEKRFGRIADALGIDPDNPQNRQPFSPGLMSGAASSIAPVTTSATSNASVGSAASGPSNPSDPSDPSTASASSAPSTGPLLPDSKNDSSSPGSNLPTSVADLLSRPLASTGPADSAHSEKSLEVEKPASVKAGASSPVSKTSSNAAKSALATAKKSPVILSKETPREESVVAPKPVLSSKPSSDTKPATADHRLQRPSEEPAKTAADARTKEVEDLFRKGMNEFRDKHFGEAQICFKKILVIDPRNVDAYYNLGSMAEAKKDYVDALTYYRAALVTRPTDKDLKSAVHAMEEELHKQRGKTATSPDLHSSNAGSAAANGTGKKSEERVAQAPARYTPELSAAMQPAPVSDAPMSDAPTVPAEQVDPKTFSLQTAQNGLNNPLYPMNPVNAPYQGVPIYGVPATLSGNVPANGAPIGNISPTTRANRTAFNSILRVGAGYALQGTGLHCPICRVMGGFH